ncbi:MAG: hypothetical protein IRZ08_08270 [Frankia sp.]|nr:hypothetical protein [Frankia sp.]
MLLLLAGLSACGAIDNLSGNKKASLPEDCSVYQDMESDETYPLLLVLLDLSTNSAELGSRIAAELTPYLEDAIANGEYVRLLSSGGTDSGIVQSECFSGTAPFLVERNNSTREHKDREVAVESLRLEIEKIVQTTRISPTGSATGLLARIPEDINAIRSTPGAKVGDVTVLVWTDLLGVGQDTDCLNVDGKKASISIAEGIVKRCFTTAQIKEVDGAKIRFLGLSESGTGPQLELARYIKTELCLRLSDDCS